MLEQCRGCCSVRLRDTHAECVANVVCAMPVLLPDLLDTFSGYKYGSCPLGSSLLKENVCMEGPWMSHD